jgi:hypothetical protein
VVLSSVDKNSLYSFILPNIDRMNFVYPSYRPSLQRSPSDPQATNQTSPSGNLFYPYVSHSKSSQKVGRFTIEPSKINNKPSQKIGRFTVTSAKPNNEKPQKVGRFTIQSSAKGGYKKSRSKRKRRSVTKKSRLKII